MSLHERYSTLVTTTPLYKSTTTRFRFGEFHQTFQGRWQQFCQYRTMLISHQQSQFVPQPTINSQLLQPGQYVSAVYDKEWYIGVIVARSDENQDIQVKFMKRRSMKLAQT